MHAIVFKGLDPARPGFYKKNQKKSSYLDISDASFVDVLHCNGGQLGTKLAVAHADFFPDGGITQEGCSFLPVFDQVCNHLQCVIYFTNSIGSESKQLYKAYNCDDWESFTQGLCDCEDPENTAYMGEACDTRLNLLNRK